jgi:hypothetical protein
VCTDAMIVERSQQHETEADPEPETTGQHQGAGLEERTISPQSVAARALACA